MPINAGIDWLGRIMVEEVGKLAIVPYFGQAGYLLYSASTLWEGRRPGRGRVRSAELAKVGYKYLEQAFYLRRSALGWADFDIDPDMIPFPENNTFPTEGPKVGPLLARGLAQGGYHCFDESKIVRSNQGALRLTTGALSLAIESLQIAQAQLVSLESGHFPTGSGIEGRKRFITSVEDELELLVELPCFAPPARVVSLAALVALRRSALFGAAADLCNLQARMEVCWGREWHDRDPNFSQFGIHWPQAADLFGQRSSAEYEQFAHEAEDELVVEALLSVRKNWYSHCEINAELWYGKDEARRSEIVIVALLNLLLQAYRAQHPEDDQLRLDFGRKALPAPIQ